MGVRESLKNTRFRLGVSESSSLSPSKVALALAVVYVVLISTYIFISGHIAAALATSKAGLECIEQVKGLLFTVVTGGLLFIVAYLVARRIRDRDDTIIR